MQISERGRKEGEGGCREEGERQGGRVGGKGSVKTGKEGRTMSGKGVESVEARRRNRTGRCMFPEMKRGKTTNEGKQRAWKRQAKRRERRH